MKPPIDIIESFFGKGKGQIVAIAITAVWLTAWSGMRVRDVEKALLDQFHAINQRIDKMERNAELNWTVQMQSVRDSMVAKFNTNNWIPSAWEIYFAVRNGREPANVRITP